MNVARKKIAAILTIYRPQSHADVIVTKFLEGYYLNDMFLEPRVKIASIYTDQVPENDISHDLAEKHEVPIYGTIREALTLGGERLIVDGILLIAEHGDYPSNEWGQKLYPKRRFFEEIVSVINEGGRPVPLFNDKHLSHSWDEAFWMYETAKSLRVPFMAGSSLPVTWRVPPLKVPLGSEIDEAVAVGYGDLEAYGFHALESLQCMVERRKGGETGVESVQCLEGEDVWNAWKDGLWSAELAETALKATEQRKGDIEENAKKPFAFLVTYRDGLKATILMLQGHISQFAFAARLKEEQKPLATRFHLEGAPPFGHFSFLVHHLENMFLTGQAQYPVERTLLTTGILSLSMESRHKNHERLETPQLTVRYSVR